MPKELKGYSRGTDGLAGLGRAWQEAGMKIAFIVRHSWKFGRDRWKLTPETTALCTHWSRKYEGKGP